MSVGFSHGKKFVCLKVSVFICILPVANPPFEALFMIIAKQMVKRSPVVQKYLVLFNVRIIFALANIS
jgi:hypothetical protein